MKYFFILGNNPTLSIAELLAVFNMTKATKWPKSHLVANNILILETTEKINAQDLIKRLGGTIKIGIIDKELEQLNQEDIKKVSTEIIDQKQIKGKFKFGISYYGSKKINLKPLGMEIKKYLKEKSISSRWVTGRDLALSSVIVEQNKLIDKGIEIVISEGENPDSRLRKSHLLVGHTLAVQPFKELSFRDYGRPARDDRSGMLPPKLAQIMINLGAQHTHFPPCEGGIKGGLILDPFCGSGTILTEAMLMFDAPSPCEGGGWGEVTLIGADISKKAVEDTEKNINWIIKKFKIQNSKFKIFQSSATEILKIIKPQSVDAIITEPYLGPQRGKINLKKIIPELEKLYSDSLKEFDKILKQDGRVVMVWPVFQGTHNKEHRTENILINPELRDLKIVNPIPSQLGKNPAIQLTNRNTIIYGRERQKVWREIVILKNI